MGPLSVSPMSNVGVLWPIGWMDQDETWRGGRPRPRRHCFRWGPRSPQKGHSCPNFWLYVYCGQTGGWISMPLGMDRPQPRPHCVRWRPTPPKGAQPPIFGPCLLWPNGWMDQMLLGTEVGLGPGHVALDGDPSLLRKGAQQPSPNFRPMSTVAKWLDGPRCHLVDR